MLPPSPAPTALCPQGDTCCWICDKCEPYEFVLDEHTCSDCGHGSWPYEDKLSCYQLEVQYMKWSSPLSVGPIVIAVLGTFASRPCRPVSP